MHTRHHARRQQAATSSPGTRLQCLRTLNTLLRRRVWFRKSGRESFGAVALAFCRALRMRVAQRLSVRLPCASCSLSTTQRPSVQSAAVSHASWLLMPTLSRSFFKYLKPHPSSNPADPFYHLQTDAKQLNKVFRSENALYHSFFNDNPKLLRLAKEMRQQILEGQDKVRNVYGRITAT